MCRTHVGLCIQESFLESSSDHMGYWDCTPGELCRRQAPYLLYLAYHSLWCGILIHIYWVLRRHRDRMRENSTCLGCHMLGQYIDKLRVVATSNN